MPVFPYVPVIPARIRKDPLGPITVNQLQDNIAAVDALARVEHFADGQHNALEVPWVLGHIDDGATPTGYLFDPAYGGNTLARPATGAYTVSVVSGVVQSDVNSNLRYSAMANVADSAIESKPHTISVEAVSDTSFKFRVRELSSALGSGNSWADVNRDIDVGLHADQQPADLTTLFPHTLLRRNQYLTQQATNWNALVQNQGLAYAAATLEHTSAGAHNVNRIAKAVAWVKWDGANYSLDLEDGVFSVTKSSTGVVELIMDGNFPSTNTMACFPEIQPATTEQLCIINGRGFATGLGTSAFRFYLYGYSGGNWGRVDQSFFAAMYGVAS